MIRQLRRARRAMKADTPIPVGMCLREVRQAMDLPAAAADATSAWRLARNKHFLGMRPDQRIPRGVPVFWTGGRAGHGHVAIATGYGRGPAARVLSPGVPGTDARWRKVTVADISKGWGLELVGYSYDLNGHPVPDVNPLEGEKS